MHSRAIANKLVLSLTKKKVEVSFVGHGCAMFSFRSPDRFGWLRRRVVIIVRYFMRFGRNTYALSSYRTKG